MAGLTDAQVICLGIGLITLLVIIWCVVASGDIPHFADEEESDFKPL